MFEAVMNRILSFFRSDLIFDAAYFAPQESGVREASNSYFGDKLSMLVMKLGSEMG
jgi:hypothetical protein